MCKYLVNEEMLGKRTTGYMVFNSGSKDFVGVTEKQIKDCLTAGEKVYGFILDESGNLAMDKDGWKTNNYMVRSGINTLRAVNDLDGSIVNIMYVVVGVKRVKGGDSVYEVINSRYGRVEMPESKVKILLELGAVQGGVYLDGKGKVVVCEGVEVIEEGTAEVK